MNYCGKMNNYCRNCGQRLEKDVTVCPKCGLNFENLEADKITKNKKEKSNSNAQKIFLVASIVWIIAMSLSIYFNSSFISSIRPLLYVIAFIILVYGKIAMKGSKIINMLFYTILSMTIYYFFYCMAIMWICSQNCGV